MLYKHQHLYSRLILVSHKKFLLINCSASEDDWWRHSETVEKNTLYFSKQNHNVTSWMMSHEITLLCLRILNGKSNSLFSLVWKLWNTCYPGVSTCQKAMNNKLPSSEQKWHCQLWEKKIHTTHFLLSSIRELASFPTIGDDLCLYNTHLISLTYSALLRYTYRWHKKLWKVCDWLYHLVCWWLWMLWTDSHNANTAQNKQ